MNSFSVECDFLDEELKSVYDNNNDSSMEKLSLIDDSHKINSLLNDSHKINSLLNDSHKINSLLNDSHKINSLLNDSSKKTEKSTIVNKKTIQEVKELFSKPACPILSSNMDIYIDSLPDSETKDECKKYFSSLPGGVKTLQDIHVCQYILNGYSILMNLPQENNDEEVIVDISGN
jgi:hypothetical protein